MTLDAILAIAHHLIVFALVALLAVEILLVYIRLDMRTLRILSLVDGWIGVLTMAIAVVGVARVLWGAVPADYYLRNYFFWTKMTFLSIFSFWLFVPGIRVQRWHKKTKADPDYEIPAEDYPYVRRTLWIELALLVPVPIAAALMARGYGVF
jgi:putative membrane protein